MVEKQNHDMDKIAGIQTFEKAAGKLRMVVKAIGIGTFGFSNLHTGFIKQKPFSFELFRTGGYLW